MKRVFYLCCVLALTSCDSVRRLQKMYPDEFPKDIYAECMEYYSGSTRFKPQERVNPDSLCGEWTWESWGGDKMGLTLTTDGRYVYTSEWRDCPMRRIEGTYEWVAEQNKLVLHDYYTRKQIRRDHDLRLKYANLPHQEMIVIECKDNQLGLYLLGGITSYYVKE